ncbi:MAG TPA: LysM peptidoglycan-binding domain-containing protein [Mucilaginibacter sp.]|nr:LysM peptidoglycan-binding domain-containing protein [Mucilaginibacter sp.]
MKKTITLVLFVVAFHFVKATSLPSKFPTLTLLQSGRFLYHLEPGIHDTTMRAQSSPSAGTQYSGGLYKDRLDSIQKDIQLDYNEYVQNYIDIYLHNRDEMAKVIGLAKYYFPIYEKAFHDAGIPDEIKYLSIVESKLDPYAVSRVGATGPWQFMYTTAKLYGLTIDDYVDERRDPIQASYAAAAYLKDAYQEFGDWLVAIASYNCGKSNVDRAIERAGGATDFWSIRPYLPSETRNYVPAFIAIAYVMNYYDKHNIEPLACNIPLKTDTLQVNKYLSLSTLSQSLNIDLSQLTILNPAYKRQIINGTVDKPRRMIIPQIDKTKYSALYDVLNTPNGVTNNGKPVYAAYRETKNEDIPAYHKVKRGETLSGIADRYGIAVQDIKVWNHLHSNKAVIGQKLKVKDPSDQPHEKTTRRRQNYVTYKVKSGDTLSGIAQKFDASVQKIKDINGLKKDLLQPGMLIKIDKS